jgi:hypothetical protein
LANALQERISFLFHLEVPEPQDEQAKGLEIGVAYPVVFNSFRSQMGIAIEFDNQGRSGGIEVRDV